MSSITHARPSAAHPSRSLRQQRWRKFLSYYRPHLPLLAGDLAAAMVVAATAAAQPLVANIVTTRLIGLPPGPDVMNQILLAGGVMLLLLAVQVAASFFVDYHGHMMGARIEADVRQELFEHAQKLSFGFHDRTRTGQLMSRITHDSLWLGELFHHGPEDLTITVLKFAGAIAVLVYVDPALAGCIAVLFPFAVGYALHFNGRMSRALARSKHEIAAVNERVEDALGGIRVVQSFANEPLESQRFATHNRRFLESRRDGYRSEAWFSAGADTFAQLVVIVVIIIGALRVRDGALTIADMLTFLLAIGLLVDPVQRLANIIRLWQEGHTGFLRAMEILEVEPDIADRPGAMALVAPRGAIGFRNVGFRYGRDCTEVFSGLSFDIAPGSFVALVGPSGVGKTTLCSLIPRFYDVTAGAVLIDGTDIRDVTLASLRRQVGVVQQDVYLFAGTVAENLRYGRPDASEAEIVAAARAANAHDFITALPDGYGTDIGQRGVRLSGGQKQRLTIARAFLKDPAILIFDEATSALDTESERLVQESMTRLAHGRTTIVIAHRLSTIRNAGRILVLGPDGIGEDGTHETLMAKGGAYWRLQQLAARI